MKTEKKEKKNSPKNFVVMIVFLFMVMTVIVNKCTGGEKGNVRNPELARISVRHFPATS